MKKLLSILCICLVSYFTKAQSQSQPQLFVGNAAVNYNSIQNNLQMQMQIGDPIEFFSVDELIKTSIGFPYGVLYIASTFSEETFEVSKGYYGDRIQLDWTLNANKDDIENILIYRRLYTADSNTYFETVEGVNQPHSSFGNPIATLSNDDFQYIDNYIQGATLYEYLVYAKGVSVIPEKYTTYITGIGYRNPTAIVTGNISFDGGSPVKDVIIRAEPEGAEINFGSSIQVEQGGFLDVRSLNKKITDKATFQSWMRLPEEMTNPTKWLKLQKRDEITEEVFSTNLTTTLVLNGSGEDKELKVAVVDTETSDAETYSVTLKKYYPTGDVDGKGDDIMKPISEIHENFIHLSTVLEADSIPKIYLNGRLLNDHLIETITIAQEKEFDVTKRKIPTLVTVNNYTYPTDKEFNSLVIAEDLNGGIIDEIRLWRSVLDEKTVRQDFKRYLGGTETDLIMYLRANEENGLYAYDLSAEGYDFNKNKAFLYNSTWTTEATDRPTSNQLGILGVSDENGNYLIAAIPYAGAGESFNITPTYGVHQFSPNQQLIFLGEDAKVVNQIDFKDISSFIFRGKARMDVVGTFEPIMNNDGSVNVPDVLQVVESGYNQYNVTDVNGNQRVYHKGDYQAGETPNTIVDMPNVGVADANVYIDGEIVLNDENVPVKTDADGSFVINVPIGNHYIEVKKNRHVFTYGGRFPMTVADALAQEERIKGSPLTPEEITYIEENHNPDFEFFEHQEQSVTFLDTTKVTLVGKVVGGSVEAEKPIGFGAEGYVEYVSNEGTSTETRDAVSAVNNIGKATIKLSHQAGDIIITTNEESGEYSRELAPLPYVIEKTSTSDGVTILNDTDNISSTFLNANEILNLSEVPATKTSKFSLKDVQLLESDPYHFEKSFVYRSAANLYVTDQTSAEEVKIGEDTYSVKDVQLNGKKLFIYKQLEEYSIEFETYELYKNYDETEVSEFKVPITDGEFIINNNLAFDNSVDIKYDENDKSKSSYTFKAGYPTIAKPFLKTISINYRVNGIDTPAIGYEPEGLILGGKSDGSQTFVTAAPDVPDIILRDPPGSNSFASIEQGQSISVSNSLGVNTTFSDEDKLEVKSGVTFEVGGGMAGPVTKVETESSASTGISTEVSASLATGVTKTYSFNQTISTSDDIRYVGADADLFIGTSKNYFYGSYDNIQSNTELLADAEDALELKFKNTDGNEVTVYITKQKAMYFSEEPSNTFFIYSQGHIVETLIPELELIIDNINNGIVDQNTPGILKVSQYEAQIKSWKKIIMMNELAKYKAINNRNDLKPTTTISALSEFIDEHFYGNISFDSAVGQYTSTIQSVSASEISSEFSLDLNLELTSSLGVEVNDNGLTATQTTKIGIGTSLSTSLGEEDTTTFSYTLQDNDEANLLSVDIINTFDGYGPIFSTQGGRTSCPYEGAEESIYFNNLRYTEGQEYVFVDLKNQQDNPDAPTNELTEALSYATQQVEVPLISVEVAELTNIPADGVAEFNLTLENNGIKRDREHFNLKISSATNPYNAITNIHQNGYVLDVPYGEKTEFLLTVEKSSEDQYEYKDLEVVLESLCDEIKINSSVKVSASFVPSCSKVVVSKPFDNWVVNHADIYNIDGTTNNVNVELSEFNPDYNSFKKIDLQYRKSTSSSWNRLFTYYKAPFTTSEGDEINYLATARENGEDKNASISTPTLSYALDVADLDLSDGAYEIRAISYCTDDTEFVSDVISGTVDLTKPQQFGTPSPTDGILNAGEDLRLQFSEPISYNSAISKIEIVAETNELPINHAVSVYFNGAENTMTVDKTNVFTGDYSIEFWMNNQTVGDAVIMEQENGFTLELVGNELVWTLGGETVQASILQDDLFHHYTLTYHEGNGELRIYEDSTEAKVETVGSLEFTNRELLTIGGNNFIGNIHDLRMWTKSISLSESVATLYKQFTGSERDLVGYWRMNEGQGTTAKDLARYIHANVNAEWDVKPKTTVYEFKNNQYLTLNLSDFSQFGAAKQIDDEMDITLSFWVKTDNESAAGLITNGRGTDEDFQQSNGKRNKWAVEIDDSGRLVFNNENMLYQLTDSSIADNSWHHVAMVVKRSGVLKTYLDTELVSSFPANDIGGISGNKFWIGARGYTDPGGTEIVDRHFTGKLEEIRLWNSARTINQISRDSRNEIASTTLGLVMYANMNAPEIPNGNGPKYFHALSNNTTPSVNAVLSSGTPNYSEDSPKLKPKRELLSFDVAHVINGDEIIITPQVSDWAVLEDQILDITVDRFFDAADNRQASPITWTAFVSKNNVEWYVNENEDVFELEKTTGDPYEFEITLLNKGGVDENFEIKNIPDWLTLSQTSGTLDPDSQIKIDASIDSELTIGDYIETLYLETDFSLDEKLQINLRVLGIAPNWSVNQPDYSNSMNIIGKIKINDQFSRDKYTKIGAFVNNEARGEAHLTYDTAYETYFVYLTVYSNVASGEDVTFKIWDALNGKVLIATIDDQSKTPFIQNEVLGSKTNPTIFADASLSEQTINVNSGWTWVSFFVDDSRFSNIKTLFEDLTLQDNDLLKSQSSFTRYDYEYENWFGSLSTIESSTMYKVKLAEEGTLILEGIDVDGTSLNLTINQGWNWLAFPIHKNMSLQEALSLYDPKDGDVIKDQYSFAIYDAISGWSGSLNYMQSNRGYMLKSGTAQTLNYPNTQNSSRTNDPEGQEHSEETIALYSKYNSNMSVVAEFIGSETFTEVLVYDTDGVLRGASPIVSLGNRKMSFISVFSNTDDVLKFMVSDGINEVDVASSFVFENNKVYGNMQTPVVLSLASLSTDNLFLSNVVLYPNPFSNSITIDSSQQTEKVAKIEIYSTIGVLVKKVVTDTDKTTIDTANLANGVYLIKVTTASGRNSIKKMVKK